MGPFVANGVPAAIVSAAALWRGAHARARLFVPALRHVPDAGRHLALTFDDGPSESTPELLELLDEYGVKATFFMCGANVERLPHVARAVIAGGHEVGNHTHTHMEGRPGRVHPPQTRETLLSEVMQAQLSIQQHTGVWPSLFRAPCTLGRTGQRAMLRKLDLQPVLCSVDSQDLNELRDRISEKVMQNTVPGSIICLHDGRGIQPCPNMSETLAALRTLLPAWRDQGFVVGTVSELLSARVRLRKAMERSLRLSTT